MPFSRSCYVLLLFLFACSAKENEQQKVREVADFSGYNINNPAEAFELPDELEEISGLATVSDSFLIGNEDETANIYLFNLKEGKVEEKFKWGKKGDYEGIALVEETVYVLKSNGTIYKISNYQSAEPDVKEIKTALPSSCDAEGLTYLATKNALLIACKEGANQTRIIYEFNLEEEVLKSESFLQMDFSEIENFLIHTGLDKFSLQLRKMLDPKGSSGVLFPSGIAIHPLTNDLYILSAKSKLLVIYADGKFKEAIELTHKLYKQPEGIAFAANGDLFIGNEGRGGRANILKLDYDQQ